VLIKDYITIDNVLSNPQELIDLTNQITFHRSNCDEVIGVKSQYVSESVGWRGLRSDSLEYLNANIFRRVMAEVFSKSIGVDCRYQCEVDSYLHFAPETIEKDELWWHRDLGNIFAGVIYLNPKPMTNSGTILNSGEKEINIENVFNRLTFYKSDILHRPGNVFGRTINDSRLTLTIFVKNLTLSVI